jgi:oxaloacetate decarboxylase
MGALIFDPWSARIAEMRGMDLCYIGGSVMKSAELALPDDIVMTNLSDIVDICRRITRAADVTLIMDVDDAGGTPVTVWRTVRELEAAGIAGIEIEDNRVPAYYGESADRHELLTPLDRQVELFAAAVAAKRDPDTVIIARTAAHTLTERPSQDFLERVAAYSKTGADAILLIALDHHGGDGRADVEAARGATDLPIIAMGLSWQLQRDEDWLRTYGVKIRVTKDNWAFRMAVKAVNDCFEFLEAGGNPADLADRCVPLATVRQVMTHSSEFKEWSSRYDRRTRESQAR